MSNEFDDAAEFAKALMSVDHEDCLQFGVEMVTKLSGVYGGSFIYHLIAGHFAIVRAATQDQVDTLLKDDGGMINPMQCIRDMPPDKAWRTYMLAIMGHPVIQMALERGPLTMEIEGDGNLRISEGGGPPLH